MKVLLVNYEYPPLGGGAANATWFMARALVGLGHQPTVLTSAFQNLPCYCIDEGVRVYRTKTLRRARDRSNPPEMASFLATALLSVLRIANAQGIEGVITFFTIPSGPVGLYLNRRLALPYIVSLRGGDVPGLVPGLNRIHSLLKPLRRLVLRRAGAVVANSASLAGLSQNADPVPVRVIPNGVDTIFFRPASNDDEPANADVFRILFVGRLPPDKNVGLLLEAVADLRGIGRKGFSLDIVGDGPARKELERVASGLGLSDCVRWHGWRCKEEVAALYRRADCFVNPSLYEGMPNTILEAMASGLPVIASSVGGNDDLVTSGETGFLFDLSRPSVFREQLAALMDDHALRKAMGVRGREIVLSEYSWRSVAERYVRFLMTPADRATSSASDGRTPSE